MDSRAQDERTVFLSRPSLQLKIQARKHGKRLGKNLREAKRLAKIYQRKIICFKHNESMTIASQQNEKNQSQEQKEGETGAKKMKKPRSKPIKQLNKLSGVSTSFRSNHHSNRTLRSSNSQNSKPTHATEAEKSFVVLLVNIHVLYSLRETMANNLEMLIKRIRDTIESKPDDSVLQNYQSLLQDQTNKLQLINNAINGELFKYETLLSAF